MTAISHSGPVMTVREGLNFKKMNHVLVQAEYSLW